MRTLQLLLVTLLCWTIPLQGGARLLIADQPCPPAAAAMQSGTGKQHDCCETADKAAKSAKSCKAEQNCQPLAQGILDQPSPLPFAAGGGKHPRLAGKTAASFIAFPAWRPPTRA